MSDPQCWRCFFDQLPDATLFDAEALGLLAVNEGLFPVGSPAYQSFLEAMGYLEAHYLQHDRPDHTGALWRTAYHVLEKPIIQGVSNGSIQVRPCREGTY